MFTLPRPAIVLSMKLVISLEEIAELFNANMPVWFESVATTGT